MTQDTEITTPIDPADEQGLVLIKTKVPRRTALLLDELLKRQRLTIYEYLQMAVSLYITFAKSDYAWIETSDQFKHPLFHAYSQLMQHAEGSEEFIRTFRQMEGMRDVRGYNLADRIESLVTTFKGGQTVTMQNPGLFAEFSYSANDALDSIISHVAPLSRVVEQLKGIYAPDKTTADILLTALCDHLEDIKGKTPTASYTQNTYGEAPKRRTSPRIPK